MHFKTTDQRAIFILMLAAFVLFWVGSTGLAHSATDTGASVLQALYRTPPHSTDAREGSQARMERLRPVAWAFEHESNSDHELAVLLTLWQHESMGARYVQEDRCSDGPRGKEECDGGKALGVLQLQRSACPEAWQMPASGERLRVETRCALVAYRKALQRCRGVHPQDYVGGLSGYRGRCTTGDSFLRGKTFRVYADVLTNGWPSAPQGFKRADRPPYEQRKRAQAILGRHAPGDWVPFDDESGALVEWHWHDFGGEVRPRGWHRGVSLFRRDD